MTWIFGFDIFILCAQLGYELIPGGRPRILTLICTRQACRRVVRSRGIQNMSNIRFVLICYNYLYCYTVIHMIVFWNHLLFSLDQKYDRFFCIDEVIHHFWGRLELLRSANTALGACAIVRVPVNLAPAARIIIVSWYPAISSCCKYKIFICVNIHAYR